MTDQELQEILELKIDHDYAGTVREYLGALLLGIWQEGEGFSGKRPFGDSGWEYDLYLPLVQAGLIPGQLDEDGFIEDVDHRAGDNLITLVIKTLVGI